MSTSGGLDDIEMHEHWCRAQSHVECCGPGECDCLAARWQALRDAADGRGGSGLLAPGRNWLLELRGSGGPDMAPAAPAKLAKEAAELAADPTSLEEMADVLLCIAGVQIRNGWSDADLLDAVRAKIEINRARIWDQQPDGTWQHRSVT